MLFFAVYYVISLNYPCCSILSSCLRPSFNDSDFVSAEETTTPVRGGAGETLVEVLEV